MKADAYAKSVEIQNENEDLILSDNYFDTQREKKTSLGFLTESRNRSPYEVYMISDRNDGTEHGTEI